MSNRFLTAFTAHPASVDETYGEHFVFAGRFGLTLIGAGIAACLHGLLPFAFKTTASRTVQEMARKTSARAAAPMGAAGGAPSGAPLGTPIGTMDWSV